MSGLGNAIVFFDSECLLCDRGVQWLAQRDPDGRLKYAPLGGETFQAVAGDTGGFAGKKTMVFAHRGADGSWQLLARSDAVIGALETAGGAPVRLRLLRIIPRPLRDLGYRIVAAVRYRLFGKVEACSLAGGKDRERLLP